MAAVRIDLHVHSNASDGTDAPAEVIRRAAAAGLDVVALTDHDTQAGIAEARAALPPGLTLVPGMELSCQLDEAAASTCSPTSSTRTTRRCAPRRPRSATTAPTGPRRWSARCGSWAPTSPGSRSARSPTARSSAARTSPAPSPPPARCRPRPTRSPPTGSPTAAAPSSTATRPTSPARCGLVRAAGGVPVLAHPRSPGYEIPDEVIAELAGAGLCGIEVFHLDHDESERSRLTQLAKSLNLIMTGGSDDHGTPLAITAAWQPRRRRRRSTSGCSPWPRPPRRVNLLLRPVNHAATGTGGVRLECPLALEPF